MFNRLEAEHRSAMAVLVPAADLLPLPCWRCG